MDRAYIPIGWENYPSDKTPIDETNLNNMDLAISVIDKRVVEMDSKKLDKSTANSMVKSWRIDVETGVISVTYLSGETRIYDLNIEKIPVSFSLSEDGVLSMITEDGTTMTADIASMIPVITFNSSNTIAVSVSGTGKNKTYSFSVKNGSITGDMLEPNYLANVQVASATAQNAAEQAALSASEANASKQSAAESEENSILKAAEASVSEYNAAESKQIALSAKDSAVSAKEIAVSSKETAVEKASECAVYATTATQKANAAAESQSAATLSAQIAEQNANTAIDKSILAESYAKGGTGTRAGEDMDNAYYYMQQAKSQSGDIPTKLSDLDNDMDFVTSMTQALAYYYKSSQVYTKEEVDEKISAIPKFSIEVVDALPTENISDMTIYLLKEKESGTNNCSEWVYINSSWEKLGDIDIDLSGYLKNTGDGSNLTETFSQASSLVNIVSGESHSTIFGKIAKAIATLISHISTVATTSVLGHVKVDSALSSSSENPVQNNVVNAALSSKLSTSGDGSNVTVNFTEATTLANISNGEKLSVSFGKLKKCISTLISINGKIGDTDISQIGNGSVTDAVYTVNDKLCGCWISFTDAEGNPTTEPYIHWYADDGTEVTN